MHLGSRYGSVAAIVAALLIPALAALGAGLVPTRALAAGDVVISQIFGGTGTFGSSYNRDLIELFNRGSLPVDLGGWSIQHTTKIGTVWTVTPLSGTIQPGRFLLVGGESGPYGIAPPAVDISATFNIGVLAAKAALVSTTTALSGTCPTAGVVDMVGFGNGTDCFEGSGPAGNASYTASVTRKDGGCTDTDDNALDFTVTPVLGNVRNSASPPSGCLATPAETRTWGSLKTHYR
jgi:uncharacterized protein